MSSLKSGAMLSLFSGFSFESVQRAAFTRETSSYDHYPSPAKAKSEPQIEVSPNNGRVVPAWNAVAHASRFAPHVLRFSFGSH